ncbi:MAG: hypothetical protein LiPW16_392 [Microgenomates group bacterium LiPW_16]|nr:MAG: hypothetical protein LiPW16_392 [Microgenomates group bacterium LiPW_16]
MSLEHYELRKLQESEVKSFSPEARAALESKGYKIYSLRGLTIRNLIDAGKPFWFVSPSLGNLISALNSEVAINPKKLFLQDSFARVPDQQVKMVEKFSRQLEQMVPGVRAVVADEPSVWGEIYYLHFDALGGEVLFGPPKFLYTITRTQAECGFAVFGCARTGRGPSADGWVPERHLPSVGVAPLIVPA